MSDTPTAANDNNPQPANDNTAKTETGTSTEEVAAERRDPNADQATAGSGDGQASRNGDGAQQSTAAQGGVEQPARADPLGTNAGGDAGAGPKPPGTGDLTPKLQPSPEFINAAFGSETRGDDVAGESETSDKSEKAADSKGAETNAESESGSSHEAATEADETETADQTTEKEGATAEKAPAEQNPTAVETAPDAADKIGTTKGKPDTAIQTKPPDAVAAQDATATKPVPDAQAAPRVQRDSDASADDDVDEDALDEDEFDDFEDEFDDDEFDDDDLDDDFDDDDLDDDFDDDGVPGPDGQAGPPDSPDSQEQADPNSDVKLVLQMAAIAGTAQELHDGIVPLSMMAPAGTGDAIRGLEPLKDPAVAMATMRHVGSQIAGGVRKAEALWSKVIGTDPGGKR
jgi:hypothetical protein